MPHELPNLHASGRVLNARLRSSAGYALLQSDLFVSKRRGKARLLGLCALSMALIWLVGVRGYADYLAQVLPERALALNTKQAEALLVQAEQALRAHRIDDAETMASTALQVAPLSGKALRILGAVSELRGNPVKAQALMELAVATTPRDTAGQFWLAINALANRDLQGCLQRLDRLMRFEPAIAADAFPILATIAISPAGVKSIAETLAANPPWRPGFMAALIRQAPAVTDVLRLFKAIITAKGQVQSPEWEQLNARLIAAGDWKQLRRVLASRPEFQSRTELLGDGGFDGDGQGILLGWAIRRVVGADVMMTVDPNLPANHLLYLYFHDRRVAFHHVSQLLLLTPGNYQLTGRVRLTSLTTAQGLSWSMTCAPGSLVIGKSELLSGTSDWREFSMTFEVPADGCGGQTLALGLEARIAAEQQISGEAMFDDFRVEALTMSKSDASALETEPRSR